MHTYIFIPDSDKKAGLGHYFRCLRYSNFIQEKKSKVIFILKKDFKKKFLKKYNLKKKKINYVFYSSLEDCLKTLVEKYRSLIAFLDSYDLNNHKINYKKYCTKSICINDFNLKSNCDYIIDHTFKRESNYHKNKDCKIFYGSNYFPFFKKKFSKRKDIILIDFGSIKNRFLISKSVKFIQELQFNNSYKIVIINKYYSKKDFNNLNLNNVIFYKFHKNIDEIYSRTLFAIGACGISLYEKCYYQISTIAKCLAKNQIFNYKNFKSSKCILDFDELFKLNDHSKLNKNILLKKMSIINSNIEKNFDYRKNILYLNKLFNLINEN